MRNSGSSSSEINLLFTSVGRRVELMNAFREAYARLGLRGRLVATDIDPLAPALQNVDRAYLVQICEQEDIRLIFPLIDPDIPLLARHAEDFRSVGAQAVVGSPDAADLTRDKWKTHAFLDELGVPAPRTWLPEQLEGRAPGFPLAFRADNRKALEFLLDYVADPIVQEFLPGPEVTSVRARK